MVRSTRHTSEIQFRKRIKRALVPVSNKVELLTCENNVKRGPFSHTTLFDKGPLVRMNHFGNQELLGRSVKLGIALRNDMKGQGTISVLNGSGLGRHGQNFPNHTGPRLGITLGRDGLVKDRGGNYRQQETFEWARG